MRQVVFAGDWHGNLPWAIGRIQSIGASGVGKILHVGDFGIWPGASGKRYLQAVENTCARHDVEMLVTPGNHEDWARLTSLWANPKRRDPDTGGALRVHLTEHLQVLPRGPRARLPRTAPSRWLHVRSACLAWGAVCEAAVHVGAWYVVGVEVAGAAVVAWPHGVAA